MKRVLTILAILLLPLSVWAMTPVSDSELSNVTGQSGVNINADLLMNVSIGTMAWGDQDGIGALAALPGPWVTTADGGYVGITNFNLTNLRIKARENDTFNGYTTANLKPITIDVAQDAAINGGRTFVRFGLGSLVISMDALSMTVGLAPATGFAGTLSEQMGSVNVGAMAMYISPISYVDIYSHAGQGVNMTMFVQIDHFDLGYVSWGDSDGLPAGNTGVGGCVWMAAGPTMGAGYIGLEDINVGVIQVSGTVVIDVATSSAGIYAHGAPGTPTTVCHISFGGGPLGNFFRVNMAGPITANVKLDNVAALNSANAGTLGDIYLSGFGLDIAAGSWVDIWAH